MSAEEDPAAAELLADAVARADTLWIAFRPGLAREHTDNVIVMRGRFRDLTLRSYRGKNPWRGPADLGGDVRRFERNPPARRSAPARAYRHGESLIVLASEAEIDSLARRLELRGSEPNVMPPDRGTVSFAARVQPVLALVADRFPAVVEALGEAHRVEGHLSLDGVGLRGSVAIVFSSPTDAKGAVEPARALVDTIALGGRALGLLTEGLTIRNVGSELVLDLTLGPDATAAVVACATQGVGCDD